MLYCKHYSLRLGHVSTKPVITGEMWLISSQIIFLIGHMYFVKHSIKTASPRPACIPHLSRLTSQCSHKFSLRLCIFELIEPKLYIVIGKIDHLRSER